jgi:hypothetical protein
MEPGLWSKQLRQRADGAHDDRFPFHHWSSRRQWKTRRLRPRRFRRVAHDDQSQFHCWSMRLSFQVAARADRLKLRLHSRQHHH